MIVRLHIDESSSKLINCEMNWNFVVITFVFSKTELHYMKAFYISNDFFRPLSEILDRLLTISNKKAVICSFLIV